MNETDIARPVVKWLQDQHWEVYQEVLLGNSIADIVATSGVYVWTLESKTSLTMALMEQANHWRAHFRSIVVPSPKSRRDGRGTAYKIAHDYLKLGVIEVTVHGIVKVIYPPPLMREHHKFSKLIAGKLVPEQKTYCEAGSRGGGYYTPYKATMERVRLFITAHPGCTLKEIMDYLTNGDKLHHYKSDKTAKISIEKALQEWEKWCRIENSRYYTR